MKKTIIEVRKELQDQIDSKAGKGRFADIGKTTFTVRGGDRRGLVARNPFATFMASSLFATGGRLAAPFLAALESHDRNLQTAYVKPRDVIEAVTLLSTDFMAGFPAFDSLSGEVRFITLFEKNDDGLKMETYGGEMLLFDQDRSFFGVEALGLILLHEVIAAAAHFPVGIWTHHAASIYGMSGRPVDEPESGKTSFGVKKRPLRATGCSEASGRWFLNLSNRLPQAIIGAFSPDDWFCSMIDQVIGLKVRHGYSPTAARAAKRIESPFWKEKVSTFLENQLTVWEKRAMLEA